MTVQIKVHDFGPVGAGTVQLKPLTIFIGPNNAGKSYLAMLTYAANHRLLHGLPFAYGGLKRRFSTRYRLFDTEMSGETQSLLTEWVGRRFAGSVPRPTPEMIETVTHVVREALQDYGSGFAAEVDRCFGRPLAQLSRVDGPQTNCSVEIRHDKPAWSLSLASKGHYKPSMTALPDVRPLLNRAMRKVRDGAHHGPAGRSVMSSVDGTWGRLVELTVDACFERFPDAAYYLPAARSGILQSHKLLASIIVGRSSFAGIEDMQVGKLAGVLSDFIGHLLNISPPATGLAGLADFLESDVIKGDIQISEAPPAYPEIVYRAGDGIYQLPWTSSMVSELAPIVLFLRYLVDPGEMMIIEEPESHLHPAVQQKFARAVARLVNAGVQVVLTTHSDFFLTQLNNQILAGGLTDRDRDRAGFAAEECLQISQVASYLFRRVSARGTSVSRMRLTRERGIPQRDFQKVAETLYAETVNIERHLPNGE